MVIIHFIQPVSLPEQSSSVIQDSSLDEDVVFSSVFFAVFFSGEPLVAHAHNPVNTGSSVADTECQPVD